MLILDLSSCNSETYVSGIATYSLVSRLHSAAFLLHHIKKSRTVRYYKQQSWSGGLGTRLSNLRKRCLIGFCTYRNLPDNTLMGEEVKWLLKEGGGLIFECFDISLESTPTLHVVYISTPTINHLSTLVPSQS